MRIDAHQHFWVYDLGEYAWIDDSMASLRSDFLPNDLKIELESKGHCCPVKSRTESIGSDH